MVFHGSHLKSSILIFWQEEAYLARVKELDEVTSERDQKRKEHEAMRKQRLDEFMAGFSVITTKLKEMYQVNYAIMISVQAMCSWAK